MERHALHEATVLFRIFEGQIRVQAQYEVIPEEKNVGLKKAVKVSGFSICGWSPDRSGRPWPHDAFKQVLCRLEEDPSIVEELIGHAQLDKEDV